MSLLKKILKTPPPQQEKLDSEIAKVDDLGELVSESLEAIDSLINLSSKMNTFSKENKVSLETFEIYKQYTQHIYSSLGFEKRSFSAESFDDVKRELSVSLEDNNGIVKKVIDGIKKIFQAIFDAIKKIWSSIMVTSKRTMSKLDKLQSTLKSLKKDEIVFENINDNNKYQLYYMARMVDSELSFNPDDFISFLKVIESNSSYIGKAPDLNKLHLVCKELREDLYTVLRYSGGNNPTKTFVGFDIHFTGRDKVEESDKLFTLVKEEPFGVGFDSFTFDVSTLIKVVDFFKRKLHDINKSAYKESVKNDMWDKFDRLSREHFTDDAEMNSVTSEFQNQFNVLAVNPMKEATKLVNAYIMMFSKAADVIESGIRASK